MSAATPDALVEELVEDAEYNYHLGLLGLNLVDANVFEHRHELDTAHHRHLTRIADAFGFNPQTGDYL